MDDTVDIDVENLFNDGPLDQILPAEHALQPSTLAIPGLAEQFLSLRYCGGYSRVSWSRQGHIASISEDGSTVSVRCLRSSSKSKEWRISAPRPLEADFDNAINVTWSPSGFDLAVLDAHGRIALYSMTTTCLNRLNETKSAAGDALDSLGMTSGIWWLNQDRQDRPRNVVANSTRGEDKWIHNMTKAKALGPLYPRAFCTVNRQGVFSLIYQRPGARYTRTSINLPFLTEVMCSHAAFSPTTENKVLVAAYSVDGDLSIYSIQITWPPDLMTDPTSTTLPDLAIDVVDSCVSMWTDVDGANNTLTQSYKPDDWALTHLTIVPTSDIETADRQPPAIWAVFTCSNSAAGADNDGFIMNSVIKRWSVYPAVRSLHSRFDEIPNKTEASSRDDDVSTVERLTDILLPEAVTSVEVLDAGQMVAISTADGRTELWNPITQALVSYEGQTDEITSLPQFGFAYNPAVSAISTVLSPNACSSLTFNEDFKLSVQYMQYPIQSASLNINMSDPHQSASVAASILAFARSCWSNTNADDVLACVLSNYTAHQYSTVVAEMYRTLFRDTEFIHEKAQGSEIERLVSKPLVTKVLSFQMSLFNSSSVSITSSDENIKYNSLSSVWAWMALNLRYIATTFYIFYREYQGSISPQQNPNQPPPQPVSPHFVDAICNAIRWTLDLFRFMLTVILETGDRQTNSDFFTPPTFANNLGDATGDGSQGLVALILNCQWSRSFLVAITRAIRAFIESNERGSNPIIARIVHTIRRYSVGKGMNISTIDKLLDSKWYVRLGLRSGEEHDNASIAKRQIAMVSTGRVGPEFADTLRMLLEKVINDPETGLRATGEIERLRLWADTPDLNWLLLGFAPQFWSESYTTSSAAYASMNDDAPSRARKLYDVHRKSMIIVMGTPDQLVRRCVRCGSLSGDIDGADKSWSKNMVGLLARCVCDAYWILEPIGGEDEKKDRG